MKIFNTIRSQEWWTYKLPPLLAIGYTTCTFSSTPLLEISLHLAIILISLVVGAIYVSVINDITDLKEDLASGKSNRVQNIPPKLRWVMPIGCLLIGLGFEYIYYPDLLSCFLYLGSWVVFSLYSIKPFRFKNRGILGVFADASGSHLFPSLLMISSVSYLTKQEINWWWFLATGVWAICYGFRGILWHQFIDRDNDIKVNLNTYASNIEPEKFIYKEQVIFAIEIIALVLMFYQLKLSILYFGIILYFLVVLARYLLYKSKVVLILTNKKNIFQIAMSDYYQTFLPLSVLIYFSLINYLNIIVLIAHILLFPYPIKQVLQDYWRLLKFMRRKKANN